VRLAADNCELLFDEVADNSWVCNGCGNEVLPSRDSFLHISLEGDDRRIAEYNVETKAKNFLVEDAERWEATSILGAHSDDVEGTLTVVYSRTGDTPMDRHLYVIGGEFYSKTGIKSTKSTNRSSFRKYDQRTKTVAKVAAAVPELAACDKGGNGTYSGLLSPSASWLVCKDPCYSSCSDFLM